GRRRAAGEALQARECGRLIRRRGLRALHCLTDWSVKTGGNPAMATAEQAVGGVSFALTDEQRELRALAREFATREIRPRAAEYDVAMRHPTDVIELAHGLGLMNLHIPPEYGGLGLGAFDGMLVGEELNWGCTGIGTSLSANGLGAGPVII